MKTLIHARQGCSPLFFLSWFPNGKFDIAEQLENLNLETVQTDGEGTAATAVCVDFLTFLFLVVVFQRLDQMEKIIEHEDPTGGSLAASPFVRHHLRVIPSFRHADFTRLGAFLAAWPK
jgi:hypothetical protein